MAEPDYTGGAAHEGGGGDATGRAKGRARRGKGSEPAVHSPVAQNPDVQNPDLQSTSRAVDRPEPRDVAPGPSPDAELIETLAETEGHRERGATLRRLMRSGRNAAKGAAGLGPQSLDALTARVMALASNLRIRDGAQLRARYPDLDTEGLARLLIVNAARNSAAVGVATGASAALPIPVTWPVELVTEAAAVIGIELKLVAELYEVYGIDPGRSRAERAMTYLNAWTQRRGVLADATGTMSAAGAVGAITGTAAAWSLLRKRVQRRVAARTGRGVVSLAPLLGGAALGAVVNRFEARRLGEAVQRDLRDLTRGRRGPGGVWVVHTMRP
jgi:uncharacterized protein (DUF697 family)